MPHYLDLTVGHIDIEDLHRTVDDIEEEDCFDFHLRRNVEGFKERYLICIKCPLLCAIVDGDENYHEWELTRSAAERGITPEHLRRRREGKCLQLARIIGKGKRIKYHLARRIDGGKTLCGRQVNILCNHIEEEDLDEREDICKACKKKVQK